MQNLRLSKLLGLAGNANVVAVWDAWDTMLEGKESPEASWTSPTQNPIRVGDQSGGVQTCVDRLEAVILESTATRTENKTPMIMVLAEQDLARCPSWGDAV